MVRINYLKGVLVLMDGKLKVMVSILLGFLLAFSLAMSIAFFEQPSLVKKIAKTNVTFTTVTLTATVEAVKKEVKASKVEKTVTETIIQTTPKTLREETRYLAPSEISKDSLSIQNLVLSGPLTIFSSLLPLILAILIGLSAYLIAKRRSKLNL